MIELIKYWINTEFWGMDIHPSVLFHQSVKFDRTYPKGVHVGANTFIEREVVILTHDMTRGLYLHTHIGAGCYLGARCIIMPGVKIGDGAKIEPGSVVTRDVLAGKTVMGNPARLVDV